MQTHLKAQHYQELVCQVHVLVMVEQEVMGGDAVGESVIVSTGSSLEPTVARSFNRFARCNISNTLVLMLINVEERCNRPNRRPADSELEPMKQEKNK